MARKSRFVDSESTFMNKVLQVSFKYGWGDFCANNNLNVGDTYFFSMIRKATCSKQYPHDFEASGSQLSLSIAKPRSFVVILKKYHLKAKYLVSTRARCRTYQCCNLPVSSFSSIFFCVRQRSC